MVRRKTGQVLRNLGAGNLETGQEMATLRLLPFQELHTSRNSVRSQHMLSAFLCHNASKALVLESTRKLAFVFCIPWFCLREQKRKTCTSTFKDGRTLQQTTEELKSGQLDPFSHENFILSALKCNVRHEGRWQDLYWSKDHRRLVCMRRAGCTHVRLRIDRIESRKFQPIMRKLIASVGHSTDIEVLDTAKR